MQIFSRWSELAHTVDRSFDGSGIVGLTGHENPKFVDISRDGGDLYVKDTSEKPFKPGIRSTNSKLSTDFRSSGPNTLVR